MDKREVMLFGDVYRVNCPRCGETEAVCLTPFAQSVFCVLCGGAVGKENVISFLRSAMLDLEELG
jgi:ribosomal protein S27E